MTKNVSAELIIVEPKDDTLKAAQEFMARCIIGGIDFYFEPGDIVPRRLPAGVEGVKAIIIEDRDVLANQQMLEAYKKGGTKIYIMESGCDGLSPNCVTSWSSPQVFNNMMFDGNLIYKNKEFFNKMSGRENAIIFEQLGSRLIASPDIRWYDAMRYNWECLVDGYEVTGDKRYLDAVCDQIDKAIAMPNTLWNCDCVAPLLPLLRVYAITRNEKLLSYAREKFDIYIKETPKFRGCFVNFNSLLNNVRAEIIFQVCPGLMLLGRLTGDKRYCDVAGEQAIKQMELLCDEKTGFWHHGRNEEVPSAAFWARGQAFVCHGLIETIEHTEISNPVRNVLINNFSRLVRELCKLQDKSGFWYSVVTEPESEFESSGTAWMCASIFKAMRLGVLGSEFVATAENAFNAVKSRIWQGSYPGHSLGTTVSKDYAYYLKRPLNTSGWTHFAFKAMCERMKTLKRN